jgi:hypothetical protein
MSSDSFISTKAPVRLTFKYYKTQELPLFYYNAKDQTYSESPSVKQLKNDYVEL